LVRDAERAQLLLAHERDVITAQRDALQNAATVDVEKIKGERDAFENVQRLRRQWHGLAQLVGTAVVEFNCLEFDRQTGKFRHYIAGEEREIGHGAEREGFSPHSPAPFTEFEPGREKTSFMSTLLMSDTVMSALTPAQFSASSRPAKRSKAL